MLKRGNALLFLALLGGCSTAVSDFELAELREQSVSASTAESIKENAEATLDSNFRSPRVHKLSQEQMQQAEGPSALSNLLNSALERNVQISAAASQIDQASAQRMNAYLGYLPQVSASYTYDQLNEKVISSDNVVYQQGEANYPVRTGELKIEQPIWDLARIHAISHARTSYRKAELDYLAAISESAHKVFETYLLAVQSKARMKSLQHRQRFLDRQIAGQSSLGNNGMGDEVSLATLNSNKADLSAEESLESAAFDEALKELARLSGTVVVDVAPVEFPEGIVGIERTVNVDEAVRDTLARNPAVLASALKITNARTRLDQAVARDFMPVVNSYFVLDEEIRTASRFGGGSHTVDATVGIKVSLPIFNATGAGYSSKNKAVEVDTAAIEHHSLSRELETQLRSTHKRLEHLTKALKSMKSVVAHSRKAYRNELSKFKNGESVDLAVATRELALNKGLEKQSHYQMEYLKSWGRLQFLMGKNLLEQEL